MDELIKIISEIDLVQLLAIAVLIWLAQKHISGKIEKLETKMDSDFKDVRKDLQELRTGLNRIEGALWGKECCMLKDDKEKKKAE